MVSAKKIIDMFALRPHPEGGYYSETYLSKDILARECLTAGYSGQRPVATAIYYLITPENFSKIHKLKSDEIFHFYMGDTVELLLLFPNGTSSVLKLGKDIENGESLQVIVPKDAWQGAYLCKGSEFALLGTTVSPGFDYKDFEVGKRESLLKNYPEQKELIFLLT